MVARGVQYRFHRARSHLSPSEERVGVDGLRRATATDPDIGVVAGRLIAQFEDVRARAGFALADGDAVRDGVLGLFGAGAP